MHSDHFDGHEAMRRRLGGRARLRLAANTWLEHAPGGGLAVRLYATRILEHTPDGRFRWSTGGWPTPLTTNRLDLFGPPGWSFDARRRRAAYHPEAPGRSWWEVPGRELPENEWVHRARFERRAREALAWHLSPAS